MRFGIFRSTGDPSRISRKFTAFNNQVAPLKLVAALRVLVITQSWKLGTCVQSAIANNFKKIVCYKLAFSGDSAHNNSLLPQ